MTVMFTYEQYMSVVRERNQAFEECALMKGEYQSIRELLDITNAMVTPGDNITFGEYALLFQGKNGKFRISIVDILKKLNGAHFGEVIDTTYAQGEGGDLFTALTELLINIQNEMKREPGLFPGLFGEDEYEEETDEETESRPLQQDIEETGETHEDEKPSSPGPEDKHEGTGNQDVEDAQE